MANKVYINKGTAVLANGEGTAGVLWNMHSVLNGGGMVSTQYDLGTLARPREIEWSCEVMFQATPAQYKGLELYVASAPDHDSTQIDGDIGSTAGTLADVDMRRNLKFIGYVVSENAAAGEKCVASGKFEQLMRYLSLVGYNDSGASIDTNTANFRFDFRTVYDEIQ